jgi:hypothetical protein
MADDQPSIIWRKSTASASSNAIEVAFLGESVMIRHSGPSGPVLSFSHEEWQAFLQGARAHEFDRPELANEQTGAVGVRTRVDSSTVTVTIYLSDESSHEQVIGAVEGWLNSSGIVIEDRGTPVFGSWFNNFKAKAVTQEVAVTAAHAVEARLVLAQDAVNTATLGQIVAPIIGSLQTTQEAVVRIGALLIVKFDGKIVVHQLTSMQQFQLDHQPELARLPGEILSKLELD